MIKIDGREFNAILSFKRNVEIQELYRVQTADTLHHREIAAKKTSIPITFGNLDKTTYDELFKVLTSGEPYHIIEIPYGYNGVKTLEVMITGISDECVFYDGKGYYWDELTVVFDER